MVVENCNVEIGQNGEKAYLNISDRLAVGLIVVVVGGYSSLSTVRPPGGTSPGGT